MDISSEKTVVISLKLTFEEAIILKGLVQNPQSDHEDARVYQLRHDIWHALEKQDVPTL